MAVLRVILGIVAGFGMAFGSLYLILHFAFDANNSAALLAALVGGLIGGVYSAVAFGRGIYSAAPLSIVGYVLDMSWSLLNTAASLLVWLPACMIAGGNFLDPDDKSRRSGTFVYQENPRGGGYDATTVGTVIAGGWSSHEEVHVWQARMFGPLYLPLYGLSLLLNMLFRLCTGKTEEIAKQAYYRVCFEDWAYSAGSTSGEDIKWGGWILWFFLSLIYASCVVLIFVGAFAGIVLLSILAAVGLIAYSLIRTFTPTTG
jgi:MFS family permease